MTRLLLFALGEACNGGIAGFTGVFIISASPGSRLKQLASRAKNLGSKVHRESRLTQLLPPATGATGIFLLLGKMAFLGGILVYVWPETSSTLRTAKQRGATKSTMDQYGGALPPDDEGDIPQGLADKLRT